MRVTPEGKSSRWSGMENDPGALSLELAKAGPDLEVVLEAATAGTG